MTDIAKRCLGYVVAGAIALALILYVVRKVDGWLGGAEDAAITTASKAQVQLHGSLLKIRAHLHAVEVAKVAASRSALAWADSARAVTTFPVSAEALVWKRIADTTRVGAAACFQAQLACEQRANSAELEAASLAAQLHAQVGVRDHPCGLWVGLGGAGGNGEGFGAAVGVGCRLVRSPWP